MYNLSGFSYTTTVFFSTLILFFSLLSELNQNTEITDNTLYTQIFMSTWELDSIVKKLHSNNNDSVTLSLVEIA